MSKQKMQRSRIKINKLEKQARDLNTSEQKKVKGGGLADGSVRFLNDGAGRSITDGTSNIKDGTSNT